MRPPMYLPVACGSGGRGLRELVVACPTGGLVSLDHCLACPGRVGYKLGSDGDPSWVACRGARKS